MPKYYNLQAFHALRIGLCVKVDQGMLTVEEATKIFERARLALLEKKAAEEESEAMLWERPQNNRKPGYYTRLERTPAFVPPFFLLIGAR